MLGLSTGERREGAPGPQKTAGSPRSLSSMSTSPALVPAANEQHAHRGGESGREARGSKGHFPFCSKETHIFLCFSPYFRGRSLHSLGGRALPHPELPPCPGTRTARRQSVPQWLDAMISEHCCLLKHLGVGSRDLRDPGATSHYCNLNCGNA